MKKRDLEGKWALVTGASSGIGLEFSRELSSRGCNILLVSNQEEQLRAVAEELKGEHHIEAIPLYMDLTVEDCSQSLLDFIDTRESIAFPDYVINNAGIFSFRPVTETSERLTSLFIDLHIRAVTQISRDFGLRMAERGHGHILNMSSMSCWMPMPGIALYSATKAYIRVFSRALHLELRDSGVMVTVACPGGLDTSLFGLPMNLRKLAVRIGALEKPGKFAHKAVNRMLRGRSQYINGIFNRMGILFTGCMPGRVRILVKRLMLDHGIRV